jgi:hypothetical protein
MGDYLEWQKDGKGVKIRIHPRVLAGLDLEPAAEFAGILLGSASPVTREVTVEDFARIAPGAEFPTVEEWFANWNRRSLPAVGYFKVGPAGVRIADDDRDEFSRHFLDALNILVLFQRDAGGTRLEESWVQPGPLARERQTPSPRVAPPAAAPRPLREDENEPEARRPSHLFGQIAAVGAGFLIGVVAYLALRGEKPRPLPPAPPAAAYSVAPAGRSAPKGAAPVPKASPFDNQGSDADRAVEPVNMGASGNRGEVQQQIRQVLGRWSDTLIHNDVGAHVNLYAPSVSPYFRQSHAGRDQVRDDIRRMVDRYGPITSYKISDLTVTPVNANQAVATFHKSWQTAGNKFSGEEKERLKFTRQGGDWLIASEQELKVYRVHRQ